MYTQVERAFRLDTKLGAEGTLLESFEGMEAVSTPFHFVVRFLAERPIQMKDLLRSEARLTVQRDSPADRTYFMDTFGAFSNKLTR